MGLLNVVLLVSGSTGLTVAAAAEKPKVAALDLLQRAAGLYGGTQEFEAQVYRRIQKIRVLRDGSQADDFRVDAATYRIINLRTRQPFNLYVEMEQFGANDDAAADTVLHLGFVVAKAGRDTGRFAYVDEAATPSPPLPDDQLLTRLRNCLDITDSLLIETALFSPRTVVTRPTMGVVNPAVAGEEVFDDQPVYKVVGKTAGGASVALWIAKDSGLILRSFSDSAIDGSTRRLVESIYKQSLRPKLTTDSFVFKVPEQPDNLNASAMGFASAKEIDDFIALHLDQPAAPRVPALTPAQQQVQQSQQIQQAGQASMVIIEGDHESVSGFITRIHDVPCAVTNLRELVTNEKIRVRTPQGEVLPVQGFIGAVAGDILLLRLSNPSPSLATLPLAKDVSAAVKSGDKVIVISARPGGSGEVIPGTVRTIGRDRLELDDVYYLPNHTGGPIIRVSSGEVIGVAAVALNGTLQMPAAAFVFNSGSVYQEALPVWTGCPLDALTKWEAIDPALWRAQLQLLRDFHATSMSLLALVQNDFATARKNPTLNKLLDQYLSHIRLAGISEAGKRDQARTLISFVRAYSDDGVRSFLKEPHYEYFKTNGYWETNLDRQVKFRSQILQLLKDDAGVERAFVEAFGN